MPISTRPSAPSLRRNEVERVKLFRKKRVVLNRNGSQAADVWYRLRKNKTAMVGLVIICIVLLLAIFADVLADYDTMAIAMHPEDRLDGPSAEHILGTDGSGRDLFARVIHGARYSLTFALACTFFGVVGGVLVGAFAAYMGGKVDYVIMRIIDAFNCLPAMLLSLSLVSALGMGMKSIIIALSISAIPGYARIVRSVMLSIVQQEYIEAARACGLSTLRIIVGHAIPNAIGLIIVNATMNMAGIIISAASLSYIGMGIQAPAPEWGAMLNYAQDYFKTAPYMALFPGAAIALTALSINLVGDGLRDALDPKTGK